MGLATAGQWHGGLTGQELDGRDFWSALVSGDVSPHTEIVHYMDVYGNVSMQVHYIHN